MLPAAIQQRAIGMSVVSVEERGPVSIISINRPEKLNAINKAVAIELQDAFAAFDGSSQRAAILTGAGGRAFSAGADVTDLPELWRCVPTVGIVTDKPIIAAVAGWCIGGGLVMAMMCDLLVATDSAKFSYPEGKVGITGGMNRRAGGAHPAQNRDGDDARWRADGCPARLRGGAGEPGRAGWQGDRGGAGAGREDHRSRAAGAGGDEAV